MRRRRGSRVLATYDLPNATGYAETCATIAYALWNYRMFRYYGDEVHGSLQRALPTMPSFRRRHERRPLLYPNPSPRSASISAALVSLVRVPPNVARFIAAMGSCLWRCRRPVYVNLYAQGTSEIETRAGRLPLPNDRISMEG
jgi:DUF1680 family protein